MQIEAGGDLRGFGWSEAPPGDYAKATLAADVLALLDAEGIDRVRIIGHDWGAYAAFLLALDHTERIDRLLALDIVPPWSGVSVPRPRHLGVPLVASYQTLLATPVLGPRLLTGGTGFLHTFFRVASGRDAVWTDAELDVYARVLSEPARARASSACYRTFITREVPALVRGGDRSAELRVPTLLAMGESSLLRRVFDPRPGPNLQVRTVEGAGHFLPEEAPTEVLSLALSWLGTPSMAKLCFS